MKHERDQVTAANSDKYSDGSEYRRYSSKRHHELRLQLGVELLDENLRDAFPSLSRPQIEILELACSMAVPSTALAHLGYSVVATDLSHECVGGIEATEVLKVVIDVGRTFPFRSECVHGIFAGDIIEHVFNTKVFLDECLRVLRPGGVLLLTTPNLATLQDRVRFLFGKAPRHVSPLHEYLWLHIRPFTASSLRGALEARGFTVTSLRSNEVQWDTGRGHRLSSRSAARLFPALGKTLVVAARRSGSLPSSS